MTTYEPPTLANATDAPHGLHQCSNCKHWHDDQEMICPQCGHIVEIQEKTLTVYMPHCSRNELGRHIGKLDAVRPVVLKIGGKRFILPDLSEVTVGRDSTSYDETKMSLHTFSGYENGVSRAHLKVIRTDGLIYVMDLASMNGTYLNGVRLMPHQRRLLHNGDTLDIGYLKAVVSF